MRAIVVATGTGIATDPLIGGRAVEMLPVADRPLVQHVLELLVEHGIAEFDFILHHLPEQLEAFVGDGRRWGATCRWHLAQDAAHPYAKMAALAWGQSPDPVLLVHADTLPALPEPGLVGPPAGTAVSAWCDASDPGAPWSGWAWLTPAVAASLPAGLTRAELGQWLLALAPGDGQRVMVPRCGRVSDAATLLLVQRWLLHGELPPFTVRARQQPEGVWLGRQVSLAPEVRLVAPLYLGDRVRIGRGAVIGPDAVVCRESVVDAQSTVTASLVLPGSYVGELLELQDAIVDRGRLINTRLGAALTVTDAFILGSLDVGGPGPWLARLAARALAALGLLLTWPVVLLAALWFALRGSLVNQDVVRLPASSGRGPWRTFRLRVFGGDAGWSSPAGPWRRLCTRVLPGLWHVACGRLHLIGLPPRTPAEIAALPDDWQSLYLGGRTGLLTEAEARGESPEPGSEMQYLAEAVTAAHRGPSYSARVGGRYLLALCGRR
jgi:hypothetical protein